jgi:hypothetical protein
MTTGGDHCEVIYSPSAKRTRALAMAVLVPAIVAAPLLVSARPAHGLVSPLWLAACYGLVIVGLAAFAVALSTAYPFEIRVRNNVLRIGNGVSIRSADVIDVLWIAIDATPLGYGENHRQWLRLLSNELVGGRQSVHEVRFDYPGTTVVRVRVAGDETEWVFPTNAPERLARVLGKELLKSPPLGSDACAVSGVYIYDQRLPLGWAGWIVCGLIVAGEIMHFYSGLKGILGGGATGTAVGGFGYFHMRNMSPVVRISEELLVIEKHGGKSWIRVADIQWVARPHSLGFTHRFSQWARSEAVWFGQGKEGIQIHVGGKQPDIVLRTSDSEAIARALGKTLLPEPPIGEIAHE